MYLDWWRPGLMRWRGRGGLVYLDGRRPGLLYGQRRSRLMSWRRCPGLVRWRGWGDESCLRSSPASGLVGVWYLHLARKLGQVIRMWRHHERQHIGGYANRQAGVRHKDPWKGRGGEQ